MQHEFLISSFLAQGSSLKDDIKLLFFIESFPTIFFASRCIIASLQKNFPGVKIFGEETGREGMDKSQINPDWIVTDLDEQFLKEQKCPESLLGIEPSDLVIWVDPLDGMILKNY